MVTLRSVFLVALLALLTACSGSEQPFGEISGPGRSPAEIASVDSQRAETQQRLASSAPRDRQILFGDLHVHTTFSIDGFAMELPVMAQ